MAPNLVAIPVLLCGSTEQKETLLRQYCSDAYTPGSAALIEPRRDFDPNKLALNAVRANGSYLLSGLKCNVPYAAESEWMLVYAALEGRTEAFLVQKGDPGSVVKEREQNMGMKAYPQYTVEFRDCKVAGSRRLGGEAGCNFELLINSSRVALAAMAVGVARAA